MGYFFGVFQDIQLAFYADPYSTHTNEEEKLKRYKIQTLEVESRYSEEWVLG